MSANIETTHKTTRSSSVNSTSSTNSIAFELSSGFLELTMPVHHRTISSSSTSTCSGGFLQLTPTCNTPVRKKSLSTVAEERQRLLLLRARDN
ncbi:hypothetical protein HI914_02079 [Erysiphe necator]|uniref:Uncharacterized protein n=1 Tax=Uncinula necator TaxID=52586 RepID=A0A0B1PD96_UNCNE|nr:hypothetical protein HI914_02079 [Erysiphe necator]KHJ34639.1 hypothetical protein EV44_g1882 [Erysiphe necator]